MEMNKAGITNRTVELQVYDGMTTAIELGLWLAWNWKVKIVNREIYN